MLIPIYRFPSSPTQASRRSHTTETVPATGRRFPHFPSMEITDNHIDSGFSRRNEKKLFSSPSKSKSNYNGYNNNNLHPVHKYAHFDSFPQHQYPGFKTDEQQNKYPHPTRTTWAPSYGNERRQVGMGVKVSSNSAGWGTDFFSGLFGTERLSKNSTRLGTGCETLIYLGKLSYKTYKTKPTY